MHITIYGDFTCPFSYLAGRRANLLAAQGVGVDWRAVEHATDLPLTGRPVDPGRAQEMREEWQQVEGLLLPGEVLPGKPPALLANTQAAVAGYAEAVGAGVAGNARDLLFTAYWVDGLDIGHPEVLRSLLSTPIRLGTSTSHPLHDFGYAVTPARGPVTTEAHHRIRDWRAAWAALGDATIPAVQHDEATLTGIPAIRRLGELIADIDHEVPEPAALTLPPPSGRFWV